MPLRPVLSSKASSVVIAISCRALGTHLWPGFRTRCMHAVIRGAHGWTVRFSLHGVGTHGMPGARMGRLAFNCSLRVFLGCQVPAVVFAAIWAMRGPWALPWNATVTMAMVIVIGPG